MIKGWLKGVNLYDENTGKKKASLLQTKEKKGWGSDLDADGGEENEYGEDHTNQNDFSEAQYESDDPNDDEDGYTGEYNVEGLNHPEDDNSDETSLLQGRPRGSGSSG